MLPAQVSMTYSRIHIGFEIIIKMQTFCAMNLRAQLSYLKSIFHSLTAALSFKTFFTVKSYRYTEELFSRRLCLIHPSTCVIPLRYYIWVIGYINILLVELKTLTWSSTFQHPASVTLKIKRTNHASLMLINSEIWCSYRCGLRLLLLMLKNPE